MITPRAMLPGAEGIPFLRRGGSGVGRLVEMRLPGHRLFSPAVSAASAVLQAGGGAPSAPSRIALGETSGPPPRQNLFAYFRASRRIIAGQRANQGRTIDIFTKSNN